MADNSTSDLAGTPLYVAPEVLIGGNATIAQRHLQCRRSVVSPRHRRVPRAWPRSGRSAPRAPEPRAHPGRDAHRGSTLPPRLVAIVDRATDPQPERRYERRGHGGRALGRRASPELGRAAVLPAVTAVAVLSAALVWIAGGPRAGAAPTAAAPPVIAVLPFKNLSTEPESDVLRRRVDRRDYPQSRRHSGTPGALPHIVLRLQRPAPQPSRRRRAARSQSRRRGFSPAFGRQAAHQRATRQGE